MRGSHVLRTRRPTSSCWILSWNRRLDWSSIWWLDMPRMNICNTNLFNWDEGPWTNSIVWGMWTWHYGWLSGWFLVLCRHGQRYFILLMRLNFKIWLEGALVVPHVCLLGNVELLVMLSFSCYFISCINLCNFSFHMQDLAIPKSYIIGSILLSL